MRTVFIVLALAAGLAACSGGAGQTPAAGPPGLGGAPTPAAKIQHIIFVIQENRTFDNIFGGPKPLPGADAVSQGQVLSGTPRPLAQIKLEALADPDNYFKEWSMACNATSARPFKVGQPAPCRMNGFSTIASPAPGYTPAATIDNIYSYVNYDETKPYWDIAQAYSVGDHFFTAHNSESYTGHQYIFSGQSNHVVDTPQFPASIGCGAYYDYCAYTPWGCDSPAGTTTYMLDPATGVETPKAAGPLPCFGTTRMVPSQRVSYPSMADLVNAKPLLTWRLYTHSLCSTINALDVNATIRYGGLWPDKPVMSTCHDNEGANNPTQVNTANFRAPQDRFLSDITSTKPGDALPSLTWILPGPTTSDHPGVPFGYCGPWWVAKIVDAVGKSKYWNSTVIFIFWDDWGGFYDHVQPYVVRDQEGPGFRVPLLVVSPYVKRNHVVKTNIEFSTLLKYSEQTLGLGSLGAADASSYLNNLNDFFDMSHPLPFVNVKVPSYALCNYGGDREPKKVKPKRRRASRWLREIQGEDD